MDLPLLDEHSSVIAADRDELWSAVRTYARRMADAKQPVLGRLLGLEPSSGFGIAEEVEGKHIALAGRHRFARYRLVFELSDGPTSQTTLSVVSYAVFPGPHGSVYRTLLLGTGGHVLAVRHMLRTIARNAA